MPRTGHLFLSIAAWFAVAALPSAAAPPPLVVDEDYAPLLEDTGGGLVLAAVLRDDNRAVIGGTFTFVNDTPQRYLAALSPTGALDPEFAANGGPDGPVFALVGLPEGGLVVGGAFRHFAGKPAAGLVRLLGDGRVDPDFQIPTEVDGPISAIATQADGRILVGGAFRTFAGVEVPGLVRLNTDGTPDRSFQPAIGAADRHTSVLSLALQADGRIAVVAEQTVTPLKPLDPAAWPRSLPSARRFLTRLRADGSVDPTFAWQPKSSLQPAVVAALPEGGLMVAGTGELDRLHPDGRVDARFGFAASGHMDVQLLLPLDENRVLVGGRPWNDATLTARLLIVDRHGTLLTRFVMPRDESHAFHVAARNQRGRLLVAGRNAPAIERLSFTKTENRVLLLDENLTIRRQFRAHVGAAGTFTAAALDGRGGITLAGTFKSGEGLTGTSIIRLRPDGSPDSSFRPVGQLDGQPHVLVPVPDGGVIVAGIINTEIEIRKPRPVMRLRGDGSPAPSFIPDLPVAGNFTDGTLLSDGTVVLVGALSGRTPDRSFSDLIRFNLEGIVDRRLAETVPSWLSSSGGRLLTVAQTASGHLLVGGEFSTLQAHPRSGLARVGAEGVVDPAFVPETDDFAVIAEITRLQDGRIFVDGWAKPTAQQSVRRRFARLLPDGRRDPSFTPPADFGSALPLLAQVLVDGTTLVVLHDAAPDAPVRLRLARLDVDGSLLPDFAVTLGNYGARLRILPARDGSVYLVGDVPQLNGAPRHGIARLVPGR